MNTWNFQGVDNVGVTSKLFVSRYFLTLEKSWRFPWDGRKAEKRGSRCGWWIKLLRMDGVNVYGVHWFLRNPATSLHLPSTHPSYQRPPATILFLPSSPVWNSLHSDDSLPADTTRHRGPVPSSISAQTSPGRWVGAVLSCVFDFAEKILCNVTTNQQLNMK